jgi:hypothetical protein
VTLCNFAQLDSKLFFERDTRLFGTGVTQTLTPRLAYNYTPYKNQNALPDFDSEKMSNLYRGHAIDASYYVSFHLAEWFQRRRFVIKHGLHRKFLFMIG